MWMNKILFYSLNIVLSGFAIYLFISYFDIFFIRKQRNKISIIGYIVFIIWGFMVSSYYLFPVYINISVATIIVLILTIIVYSGGFWNKCIFSVSFNTIFMLIETLIGYIFVICFDKTIDYELYQILGSLISKIIFLMIILVLRRVFVNEKIKELYFKYNVIFVLLPVGSIYIMNTIFLIGIQSKDSSIYLQSAISAIILLIMNVLIFYIYMKLADDLLLRQMNSVYEQQLELCERHQQEREMSMLQIRDAKHNMKNNLISVLAYAENGDCKKIIEFVNEVVDEGKIMISSVANSGNIVIDSLIGYWDMIAKKKGIDFSVHIQVPMMMPFKGADICLILGNLLENAVEATEKISEKKYIKIHIKYDKSNLLVFVSNSYEGDLIKTKDKKLKSTKADAKNHGIGLSSVQRVAHKYHGIVTIEDSTPKQFRIRVLLYGSEE